MKMTTKQLPTEVLARIIRYSVHDSEYSYTMNRWFKALQLTHVCSRWRDIGTPFVYSFAHFSKSSISSLCVEIYEDEFDDLDDLVLGHQLLQVSQRVCPGLSGVKHLSVSPSYHGLGIAFASHLTRGFLGQLYSINMVSEVRSLSSFSNSLACLQINMKFQQARNIPKCTSGSLQKLALFEVPLDYDWASFRGSDFSAHIQFNKLWSLDIAYQEPTAKDVVRIAQRKSNLASADIGIAMLFPALRRLEITNAYSCNVLKHGVFPERLQTLWISAPPSVFKSLASKSLRFVSILDIMVLTNNDRDVVESDVHAIRSLGSIYRNTAVSHGRLSVDARALAKQPDLLKGWKNLNSLRVHNALDKGAAESILRAACLPNPDSLDLAVLSKGTQLVAINNAVLQPNNPSIDNSLVSQPLAKSGNKTIAV
ncbi:hypothetical protein EV179_002669 [Coemansia sp. RSA 487]|nr:hypothetical protein EV179_002669 [Coemansia sp. RSA 487]